MINLNQFNDPWDAVELFEEKVSEYAGSKYAVSTDNCTDALFLCLNYFTRKRTVIIPKNTYISVPQTIIHSVHSVVFDDVEWSGIYQLKPYPIWDGATRFKKDMYNGGYHCLSFHIKKHIPIGKGGMILTDDIEFRDWARKARYEGRNNRIPHNSIDDINIIGWNFYMPPEQAARGIVLFEKIPEVNEDSGGSWSYTDLSGFTAWEENVVNE